MRRGVLLSPLLLAGQLALVATAVPRFHLSSYLRKVSSSSEGPTTVGQLQPSNVDVFRLRGGDAAGLLQSVQGAYLGIPPVTRSWLTLILSFAGLTQMGLLQPEAVAIDADLVVNKLQLWRPLTSAAFFGGIGPQLIQKLYYLVSFGTELESTLGLGEYLRVLVSCTAVLSVLFNALGWQFVGDGLIMAITVLCAQQRPAAQMSMYGLKIPYQFLPLAQLVMSYIFTQQIPWPDIAGLLVGYLHYYMNDQLKPDDVFAKLVPASVPKVAGRKTPGGGGGGLASKKTGGRKPRSGSIASCSPGG